MRVRAEVLIVTCGALLLCGLLVPAQASAQGYIAFGIGRGPVYSPWHGIGYPWYPPYPPYYARVRPYYPYPYGDLASAIRLQVRPREAEVFVDGYFAGIVDDFDGVFQRLPLEPGEHDVELFLPGYRSVHQRIYLQPGRTSHLRVTMEPLAPGEPEPVRPSGTPIAPARGSQGRLDTRRPRTATRPDTPSGVVETQAPAAAHGRLSLRVQPGDAAIQIDGERWDGATDEERLVVELADGAHVVEIRRDGYRDYITEVIVRAGETTTLNVALTPQ